MLLFAISVSIQLCAQDDTSNTSSQQQTYPVRGTVINSVTREPIARALVTSAGEDRKSVV